ncbi:DNA translocase FtsK, partial [Bacteriovorax sp. BSW11_IV]|uniref:DNA translocase FtsK n=1 Tax=Bacteriovorax sp. BSW11_IV TaxID=1353529 RepID=UPI000695BBF6
FTYYLSSIVSFVGYYTGPWLLVGFVCFTLFYAFVYSKRESVVDVFNIITMYISLQFITFLIAPEFVGGGAVYILKLAFSPIMIALLAFISVISFLAGSFRDGFKASILKAYEGVLNSPERLKNLKKSIDTQKEAKQKLISNMKVKVPSLLKGDEEKESKEIKENKELPSFVQGPNKEEKKEEVPGLLARITNPLSTLQVERKDVAVESNNDDVEDAIIVVPRSDDKEVKTPESDENSENSRTQIRVLKSMRDDKEDYRYYDIVSTLSAKKDENRVKHPDEKYFEEIVDLIEDKLAEFKIEGKIINVLKGPVVDTFELELGSGVKVSKVTGATEDLSLALYGAPIRIVYPMKGRTTIGIEVPRNPREIIYLDEVLNSKDFQNSTKQLPVAMGKDAFGEAFVVDLAGMPHMLVAGATGAGKSVFINSLLVSLLVKRSPKQMKLILIDPKQLELALYQNLPHLVMPVITDAKSASIALLWAVQEMERRYSILKEFGVRNIAGFNEKLKSATPTMLANIHQHYVDSGAEEYELPYLVVIVDEFADLILTKAGKEIEQNIARLAAKARAAGIHLVLATQRPSVDVITGVIKSNFPTRVSFRVTSPTDSRTILDKMGAEKLLGKGDMLYKHGIEMTRVHSSYVDEEEIEALAAKLSEMPQTFDENAMDFLENGGDVESDEYTVGSHLTMGDEKSDDNLYSEAVKIVIEYRSASASMLQRRLRIGYNRAANLIEEMESKGVVGPAQGSKPRRVLVSGEDSAQL